jgi:hypothetical protein
MERLMRTAVIAALMLGAAGGAGCADRGLGDDEPLDTTAPSLEIWRPERGAYAEGRTAVLVEGRATDDLSGVASVVVNGTQATLAADGSFSVELSVAGGVTLIQSVAIDAAGNRDVDTRAVLAGELAPLESGVRDAIAVEIDDDALDVVGEVAARVLEDTDFTEAAAALNPIVSVGGSCFGAEVYVDRVDKTGVAIGLDPVDGGLAAAVDIDGLAIDLTVYWHLACLDGDTAVGVTADRASLDTSVAVALGADGRIEVTVLDTTSGFQNFMFWTDLLPEEITDLVEEPLGAALASLLANQVEDELGPVIADYLAGLTRGKRVDVLGEQLQIDVTPTHLRFDSAGGALRLDTHLWIPGKTYGLGYVSDPAPLPILAQEMPASERDFAVALADDMVNQALGAFWAAGALDLQLPVDTGDYAGLGIIFDRIDLQAKLPPVASALPDGGGLRVVIGDLICSFVRTGVDTGDDATSEEVVTRFAASVQVTIRPGITPEGAFSADVDPPDVWIDVLEMGVDGGNPLNSAVVEELGSLIALRATGFLPDLLETIPIPTFQGAYVVDGRVTTGASSGGYLLAGGGLAID